MLQNHLWFQNELAKLWDVIELEHKVETALKSMLFNVIGVGRFRILGGGGGGGGGAKVRILGGGGGAREAKFPAGT